MQTVASAPKDFRTMPRLVFGDMHSTGIYTWDYLYELGREQGTRFQKYLDDLAAKGLSREPPKRS